MTPDASQSGLEPAASLTSVRIKRRKQPLTRSSKRGDLTAESGLPAAPEPVIALPPPASEAAVKEIERIIDRIRPPAAPELPHLFEGLPAPSAAPALPKSPPIIEATAEPAPPEMPPEILDLFELTPPAAPAPAAEPEMPELPPVVELPPPAMQREQEHEAEAEQEPEPDREESSSFIELMAPAPAEPSAPEPANDVEPPAAFRDGEALELMAPLEEAEASDDPLDGPEPEFAPVAAPEPRPRPVLVETPPEPPAEAPAPAALDAEPPPESGAADLLDYWDSLRGGRDFPSLDELDRSLVAATWPNTVLLAVDAADMPRITRLGETDGAIEYTATVIDWIMSRGRNAAKRGQPIEEEKRFPVSTGGARYRLLLLPFSSYGLKCDHVLGQLTRAAEIGAVASFKRWLAS
ncbi:MAG TPA: hypothetical protein VMA53_06385 [Stellaceae bacterium]|nr:hypothetical protein [Stellaceae bacterium]